MPKNPSFAPGSAPHRQHAGGSKKQGAGSATKSKAKDRAGRARLSKKDVPTHIEASGDTRAFGYASQCVNIADTFKKFGEYFIPTSGFSSASTSHVFRSKSVYTVQAPVVSGVAQELRLVAIPSMVGTFMTNGQTNVIVNGHYESYKHLVMPSGSTTTIRSGTGRPLDPNVTFKIDSPGSAPRAVDSLPMIFAKDSLANNTGDGLVASGVFFQPTTSGSGALKWFWNPMALSTLPALSTLGGIMAFTIFGNRNETYFMRLYAKRIANAVPDPATDQLLGTITAASPAVAASGAFSVSAASVSNCDGVYVIFSKSTTAEATETYLQSSSVNFDQLNITYSSLSGVVYQSDPNFGAAAAISQQKRPISMTMLIKPRNSMLVNNGSIAVRRFRVGSAIDSGNPEYSYVQIAKDPTSYVGMAAGADEKGGYCWWAPSDLVTLEEFTPVDALPRDPTVLMAAIESVVVEGAPMQFTVEIQVVWQILTTAQIVAPRLIVGHPLANTVFTGVNPRVPWACSNPHHTGIGQGVMNAAKKGAQWVAENPEKWVPALVKVVGTAAALII